MKVFHEYVYLSDAKVRKFIPSDVRWWTRMRTKKLAGGATLGGVQASLEFEPSDVARMAGLLDKLVDHITVSGKWYTVPGLTPGDWVFFDGRIGYQVTERDPAQGAVLFCEAGDLADPSPRIVLHGSAKHLVGRAPSERATVPTTSFGGYSAPETAASVLEAAVMSALSAPERAFWRLFGLPAAKGDMLSRHLDTLFREVASTDSYMDMAPFLGGCAQVTSVVEPPRLPFPVVVASPLFVRHERP